MTDDVRLGLQRPMEQGSGGGAHPPAARASGTLVGWLRRLKHNTWARRIVFPLLQRFPQLVGPLRRLSEGAQAKRAAPLANLVSDWPGPLPSDYVNMSEPARKALLDLARAAEAVSDR